MPTSGQDRPKFKVGDLVTFKKKYAWDPGEDQAVFIVTRVDFRNSFSSGEAFERIHVYSAQTGEHVHFKATVIKKI